MKDYIKRKRVEYYIYALFMNFLFKKKTSDQLHSIS